MLSENSCINAQHHSVKLKNSQFALEVINVGIYEWYRTIVYLEKSIDFLFSRRPLVHRSVVQLLISNAALVIQVWFVLQPVPALRGGQIVGAFEGSSRAPEVPVEAVAVNVELRERDAGHDPVYPAHGPRHVAVHGWDLLSAVDTPGHRPDLVSRM